MQSTLIRLAALAATLLTALTGVGLVTHGTSAVTGAQPASAGAIAPGPPVAAARHGKHRSADCRADRSVGPDWTCWARGAAGPAGAVGPAGPVGPTGPPGPAGTCWSCWACRRTGRYRRERRDGAGRARRGTRKERSARPGWRNWHAPEWPARQARPERQAHRARWAGRSGRRSWARAGAVGPARRSGPGGRSWSRWSVGASGARCERGSRSRRPCGREGRPRGRSDLLRPACRARVCRLGGAGGRADRLRPGRPRDADVCGRPAAGGGGGTAIVRVNEVETGTTASGADEFVELSNSGTARGRHRRLEARVPLGEPARRTSCSEPSRQARRSRAAASTCSAALPTPAPGQPTSRSRRGWRLQAEASGSVTEAGLLVDSVGWGTATNALVEGTAATAPPTTAAPGSSIVRLPDGHDSNTNAADFTVTSSPTPGCGESLRHGATDVGGRCERIGIRGVPRDPGRGARRGTSGPYREGEPPRLTADVTGRCEPRAVAGPRLADARRTRAAGGIGRASRKRCSSCLLAQLTMLLGDDPFERVDFNAHSIVSVEAGTSLADAQRERRRGGRLRLRLAADHGAGRDSRRRRALRS